jgi:hypothetical protein
VAWRSCSSRKGGGVCRILLGGGDERTVVISVPAVLLLGLLVMLLWRYAGLGAWHALVCALFGFYLASSSVAAVVNLATRSLLQTISGQ